MYENLNVGLPEHIIVPPKNPLANHHVILLVVYPHSVPIKSYRIPILSHQNPQLTRQLLGFQASSVIPASVLVYPGTYSP